MPNCYLCNKPLSGKIDRDHVIPVSAAGSDHSSNIRPTHASCNRRKHSKLVAPEVGQTYPLPLRSRSDRRETLWRLNHVRYLKEHYQGLRRTKEWTHLPWSAIRRLDALIEHRGLWISRSMWKAGMGERTKLTEYLVSRGVPEVTVRVWLWYCENNLAEAIDNQWPTE